MRTYAQTLGWTFALVLVIALAVTTFGTFAASRLHPSGSCRVVLTQGTNQIPFLATFTPNGGVTASTIPWAVWRATSR